MLEKHIIKENLTDFILPHIRSFYGGYVLLINGNVQQKKPHVPKKISDGLTFVRMDKINELTYYTAICGLTDDFSTLDRFD